ncbi:MAG TPA: hypothetical protein VJX67_15425 [Blastocatellia bacterium]|nr:hypothetical protein [Blastocatellia bacterium]
MDVEKMVEFILNQQTQFANDLEQLRDNLFKLTSLVAGLASAQQKSGETLSSLAQNVLYISKNVADISQSHLATEERFNILIAIMEHDTSRIN